MAYKNIDHINFVVSNMEQSLKFYCELLGFEISMDKELKGDWIDRVAGLSGVCARCVYLDTGTGARIELLEYQAPKSEAPGETQQTNNLGIRHLAFEVDDIEAEYKRLSSAGVVFVSKPEKVPFQPGKGGRTKQLCYFRDPDGIILELAEYKAAE